MNNFKENGLTVQWTNGTGSAVVAGQVVPISGGYCGVAVDDIANGSTGVLSLEGVFNVPKDTVAASQGAQIAITTSGSCTAITSATTTLANGRVHNAATSAVSTVDIRLF